MARRIATFSERDAGVGPYLPAGLDRQALSDERVLRALSRVPRHLFVPEEVEEFAYDDRAISIGLSQTISQPFIVALMTQEARIDGTSRVLEIGTGSGYQTAVLAELAGEVFTVEILPELALLARARLETLGYRNISFREGDGGLGWPEAAPFDAIVVTAAAPFVPENLLCQLAEGGRLIIPLQEANSDRDYLVAIENVRGEFSQRSLGAVRFVPLTGSIRGADTAE